jgi:ankyrin repeat protein
MPPKKQSSAANPGDALATVQRLSAVFAAASGAGERNGDADGARELCRAAQRLTAVELAELGSVRDQKGRTLLHHAAVGGSAEAVRRVLDADYTEEEGKEKERAAAPPADGHAPPVDARDAGGDTALGLAAGAGALQAVELLLKRGACPQGGGEAEAAAAPSSSDDDAPLTPLHRAAAASGAAGAECVRALLAAGARVDAPSGAAGTPLGMAALARNAPAARLLLAAKANPNGATASGATPLMMAAASADEELVALLLEAGADARRAANGGMTPLHALAAAGLRRREARRRRQQQERKRREEELKQGGGGGDGNDGAADDDKAAADEDKAFGCAAARLARLLLDKGADPNALDAGGTLPVVVASACGPAYRPLVDALLAATTARPAGFAGAKESGSDKGGSDKGSGDNASNNKEALAAWTADDLARYAEAQLRLQEREVEAARAQAEARVAAALGGQPLAGGGVDPEDNFDAAAAPFPPPPAPLSPPDEAKAAEIKALGDAAFVRGDVRAAEQEYTRALQHWSESAPLWCNRAAARLALGGGVEATSGALSDARHARTLDRDYVKAWYREGCAASALGRWRAAAGALAEASRLDPASEEISEALENAVGKARRAAAQQQQGRR